jgi:hypothetical protein
MKRKMTAARSTPLLMASCDGAAAVAPEMVGGEGVDMVSKQETFLCVSGEERRGGDEAGMDSRGGGGRRVVMGRSLVESGI